MKKILVLGALCVLSGCKSSAPVSVQGNYTTNPSNYVSGGVIIDTNGATVKGAWQHGATNIGGSVSVPCPAPIPNS